MNKILLIIVLMLLIAPALVTAQETIYAQEVDDMLYQFHYTGNATSIRWVFGDGAASNEKSPVHQFASHQNYTVRCEATDIDNTTESYSMVLDLRLPLLDNATGNMNVGDYSIPGVFLLVSCGVMFMVASAGKHPAANLLGHGGKDVVCFLYFLGICAGIYLVICSIYPGGI